MTRIEILLTVMFVIFGAYLTMNLLTMKSFGEDYKYNMTKDERDEFALGDVCMNTNIKIANCEFITGKINSTYGDAIK